MFSHLMNRRQHLTACTALAATYLSGRKASAADQPLIKGITEEILWSNKDGKSTTWFHPKVCMVPRPGQTPLALMNLQSIAGSDYFGPVHWSASEDLGKTWSTPEQIPGFERRPVPEHDGLLAGVCDVVPEYHPRTNTVLAVGEIVFYRGERYSNNDQLSRYPVYCVRKADGTWSDRKILEWDDPRAAFIYSNNCGQRVTLSNGDVLLAMSFGPKSEARSACSVRCSFDGTTLKIKEVGEEIKLAAGRGLLEPSLTRFDNRFYLTIRAEDQRGYVAASDDGLNWTPKQVWCWDDGEPLFLSSTQQHWLTHSDGLFLVYTRKDERNTNVIRWRSTLYVAQVDPRTLRLIRSTERIAIDMEGDGINDPHKVPQVGNFHIVNATADESWVTDGNWLPRFEAKGELKLSRIQWSRPNRLAPLPTA